MNAPEISFAVVSNVWCKQMHFLQAGDQRMVLAFGQRHLQLRCRCGLRQRIQRASDVLHAAREFQQARTRHVLARLKGLSRAGVYRQTRRGNMGIVLASLINRL